MWFGVFIHVFFVVHYVSCDSNLFMIRAKFGATSESAAKEVLNGLKIVVKYQYPYHPGVLTYNFDHIDPDDPTVLMFSEMYADTGVFLNHTNHTEIRKIWPIIFRKENEKYVECIVYGNPSNVSKLVLNYLFNTTYLPTSGGYLFSYDNFFKETMIHEPIFLTVFMYSDSDDGSKEKLIDGVNQLISLESNQATTFHLVEKKPGFFELMMIYKTAEMMVEHLSDDQFGQIFKNYIVANIKSNYQADLWLQKPAQWKPEYKNVFAKAGLNVTERYLNVGYVMHPKADPHSSC